VNRGVNPQPHVTLDILSIQIVKHVYSAHRIVKSVMNIRKMIVENVVVSYIRLMEAVYLNANQVIILMKMMFVKNVMIKNVTFRRKIQHAIHFDLLEI